MYYYHVRITVQGEGRDEIKNDLNEEELEKQFLAPYRTGKAIMINGRAIKPDRLARIRISISGAPSPQIIAALKVQDQGPPSADGPSYEWRVADQSVDVTDQFITGPPGAEIPSTPSSASPGSLAAPNTVAGPGDGRSVFIVSGRDVEATAGIVHVLRALNLKVVEWEHAVLRTGVPNPYTGDVVATGLRMADAAIIVITPDDVVKLRSDLVREQDGELERTMQGQARPNVVYEAGYADALGLNRTLIVEVGLSKPFSDIAGRNTLRYDGSPAKRNALVQRLKLAGLRPDTDGDDWLKLGDVGGPIAKAAEAVAAERKGSA